MQTVETPVEVIVSRRWPDARAEIYRNRDTNGNVVWRTKIGSDRHPELLKHKLFETKEQAIAHANVVLGH